MRVNSRVPMDSLTQNNHHVVARFHTNKANIT